MQITGVLIQKDFAKGSKSESQAVYVQTDNGEYLIRKAGDNPFENNSLTDLIGKKITAEGSLSGYVFIAKDIWEEE